MTRVRSWALTAMLGLGGCDRDEADSGAVDEPTEALRPAQQRGEVPQEARIADYVIEARLDAEGHRVEGHQTLLWRNSTAHATDRLPLHLYMNAFRSETTAWMRGGRGSHRGQLQGREQPWGFIDVTAVKRLDQASPDGSPVADLKFAEAEDPSVMEVELDAPVPPGGQIAVSVDFVTQFPEVFARTGFRRDFHLAGQWYPKVGVLEPDGTWQAHVFTFHSEFYADFGNYDVTLDVPSGMVVGATGIRVDEHDDAQRKVVKYHAEMVSDFAWTAWPQFEEIEREMDGIKVRLLIPPEHRGDAARHLEAQEVALREMEALYGPYPWSTITMVHPPVWAGGAMGMEYPTFYTTSEIRHMPWPLPALGHEERLSGVLTTVHEFGHQYFQGMLASNEQREPWLDEGMNMFSNVMVAQRWWGHDPWLIRAGGARLHATDLIRLDLQRAGGVVPIAQPAEGFDPARRLYGAMVYRRTAALMMTLRRMVGGETFDDALRTYAMRYRFEHPTGEDLVAVLVQELGGRVVLAQASEELSQSGEVALDVEAFLRQGLVGAAVVDFAVGEIVHRPLAGDAGWHRDEDGELVGGSQPDRRPVEQRADSEVEAAVLLRRLGDFRVPVSVEIELGNGEVRRLWWDGQAKERTIRFAGQRVVRAAIDPDNKLVLEDRRLDNHHYAWPRRIEDGPADDLGELVEAAALAVLTGLGP